MFNPGFTSPNLLEATPAFDYRAFTFFGQAFNLFVLPLAYPRSLAATDGVAFAFLSSRYLDVSVPWVRSSHLCIQCEVPLRVGCPIRKSRDRSLVTSSPGLIAGSYVLHRLLTPRHPPCALTRSRQPDAAAR